MLVSLSFTVQAKDSEDVYHITEAKLPLTHLQLSLRGDLSRDAKQAAALIQRLPRLRHLSLPSHKKWSDANSLLLRACSPALESLFCSQLNSTSCALLSDSLRFPQLSTLHVWWEGRWLHPVIFDASVLSSRAWQKLTLQIAFSAGESCPWHVFAHHASC